MTKTTLSIEGTNHNSEGYQGIHVFLTVATTKHYRSFLDEVGFQSVTSYEMIKT